MKKNIVLLQRILLFVVSFVCAVYVNAYDFKAENEDGVTIYYNISGTDAIVTNGSQKYEGVVKIPAIVMNDAISYNVTAIGEQAFYFCGGLQAIEIPSSVTSIGIFAFYGCSKLTALTIPGSVKSIGTSAFHSCGITTLEMSKGIEIIGSSAFSDCDRLVSVTIPSTVKSIGTEAFGNTNSLISISVAADNRIYDSPNNCNAIIESASKTLVAGCKTTIIPDGVTAIGDQAFYFCGDLQAIEIPSSVTSIGIFAFYGCSKLATLTIPSSVKSIGAYAFHSCGITVLELSEGIEVIGSSAFSNCDGLVSVTIPSTVKSIETEAFGNNTSLISISVAANNSVYESRNNCNAIIESASKTLVTGCQTTIIPDGVNAIGDRAFYFCDGLQVIEIPSSVTSIGSSAFYGCSKLIKVVSKIQEPFRIDSNVFSSISPNAVLYVLAGKKEVYEYVGGWNMFEIKEMGFIEFAKNSMRTFCALYPLDFTNVDNLDVFIASGFNTETGEVIMSKVEKVPARTGLLLVGEPNQSYEVPITETDFIYSNLLEGVTETTTISSGYVLDGDQFMSFTGSYTINAGEAYLKFPSTGGKQQLKIKFTDTTTGLEDLKMQAGDMTGWYTLQGTHLNQKPTQSGIYLHQGKKVMVK